MEYSVDSKGCWKWLGDKTPKGYGYIKQYQTRAHRVYYERYVGPIPEGLWVLHKCDVKDCVTPDHLYLGTHTDNMRDASERGQLWSPARQVAFYANRAKGREKSLATRRANALAKQERIVKYYAQRNLSLGTINHGYETH